MIKPITLFAGSALQQAVNLVTLPSVIGPNNIEFDIFDSIAGLPSPYTGQTQTQENPGADMIFAKITMPPLYPDEAAQFKAFLMEMRGMLNAVQLGDPDAQSPRGIASGTTGSPVVNTSVATNNLAMSKQLVTRGWKAGQHRLLLPGDAFQVGYRLHYAVDEVDSDGNGNATINVWPSLREQPTDGTAVNFNHPKGIFRLAANKRGWSRDAAQYTHMTIALVEFR